jgi:hypothetical protein
MLWTCTTAEQDDGRRLSSVRRAKVFQRHLLERWPSSQEGIVTVSCCGLWCVCLLCEGLLIAVVRCVIGKWVFVLRPKGCRAGAIAFLCAPLQVVIPMLWTCTTAEQDDGRRLGSVRRAAIFQRHLLERWPSSQGVKAVSC